MAITNKLITFNKLTSFETQLAQGNILETSIVFIKDAKKIWTKGTYFDCSGGSNNIAVYETTDDVYNGVLTSSISLNEIFYDARIYTIVIKQRISIAKYNVFIFNRCSDKSPGTNYFSCLYTNNSEQILYKLSFLNTSNTITLTKQDLALKSDIPNTDDFATQANLTSAVTQLTINIAKKQDKLVSGTNIKTINGESILGSGDITISGGGSSSGSAAYPEVNHGTSDTILSLEPNTFHIWDEVESLQLVYRRPTAGIANEYLFQFTSGATATTLMLPDTIKWVGGSAPTIQPNMIYQISILNGLGSVLEFDNAISFPVIMEGGNYPDVYSYFVDKYSLTNTSDNPNNGIEIQEYLLVSSSLSGGDVIKVSLNNDNLLLWTEKSEQTYYVMKITSNTFIATEYFWD